MTLIPRFAFLAALIGLVGSASAGELTTISQTGDSSNRVDVMFIGDGYTAGEIDTTYADHVDAAVNYFFGSKQPFPRYANFFNIHRTDVVSNQSGADDPVNGITRDTALDSSYSYGGGPDRLLYFNGFKANTEVNSAIAGTSVDVDMRIGVVNNGKYGGGGGQWAVYAGSNGSALEIAVHEVGHSFAGLADEYFTPGTTYNGGEPGEPNVTTDPAQGKWDRWVGYDDPDSNIGPIDYYEGGRYFENGIFRPSQNSEMRSLNRPFDAISREQFVSEIYDEVDPLDSWMDTSTMLTMHDDVWVDTVDDDVINVNWSIDGTELGVSGSMLDIGSLGLASGDYVLTATAYDSLLDHSFSGNSLDWWRLGADPLTQTISWQLNVTAVPEPTSCVAFAALGIVLVRRRKKV